MKVAVVYNHQSKRVINLFGVPNREKYARKNIKRIIDALKVGGHQVATFEGDKDLIDRLEEFMPRVVKGELPGMVFNLSYGIQGQARYTHVPGMLEMLGLPYVGSGPLAHSLALDKVVSKMIFLQHGLPTPEFAVLDAPGFEMPGLEFPLIVKPKNEAVSFGIKICRSETELREAAGAIFEQFKQPVLVERYISGREINVGLLGNSPAEALPPAELKFGESGPQIYTYEDKTRKSGREIMIECPALVDDELATQAQDLAKRAFAVLGCYDCARVDMRLDDDGKLYLLEVNSLPSMGAHGSYVEGAAQAGLDFTALCNRLVEVASARYFGTPTPPQVAPQRTAPDAKVFAFLTQRRDEIERQVEQWSKLRSRTYDPVGIRAVVERLDGEFRGSGLKPLEEFTDERVVWTWQTAAGLDSGVLLVAHLDVPMELTVGTQIFRRGPEWIFGEGVGSSRAPLVSLQFALRALRHIRRLRRLPIGVLCYSDEGRDCSYSASIIRKAAAQAKAVLVLRPGNPGDHVVTSRRGQRRFRLEVEGEPLRLGKSGRKTEVLRWAFEKLESCARLTSREDRIAVSTINIETDHLPMLLPHHVTATLLVSYPDQTAADRVESQIREILNGKGTNWRLERLSDRAPMKDRRASGRLAKSLKRVADEWEIPLNRESSVWPSVAGLVPASTGVVCGVGPVARDLYTPHESVDRISLMQRTLLLAQFLNDYGSQPKGR